MEDQAGAPRPRPRRHRRKASDAAFDDVFVEPPRFAPVDYAEVFGGVAASCSIPYLELPPPAAAAGDGDGDGEIFARFDSGDFAAPYEDAIAEPKEIGSPGWSSRSSVRKESGKLDTESSILNKYSPDSGCDKNFGEEQFYPVSSQPNDEQKSSMSYNKSTPGRSDDFDEMATCIVEPCNSSNDLEMDHVPEIDNVCTLHNGINGKVSSANVSSSSTNNVYSASVVDQLQHIPTCLPTTTATKSTWVPISENICEDESYDKRSSTHSVSSEEEPSPDYPFLRLSNISLPSAPIKVRMPPVPEPPSKLLNKRENKENGDSVVDLNSAAASVKEAIKFAEAILKAAKELMERKGDGLKPLKRPAHHRSTKSTEVKESKIPEELHLFEEKLSMRRLAKKENQNKDLPLLADNRDVPAVKSAHCDHDNKSVHCDPNKNMILSPGRPQEMRQNGNKLEELGKWTSDADFYELITHDQRRRPNAAPPEGNNGVKSSCTKLEQTDKKKIGGSVGEPKRVRKLWDTTAQRRKIVSLVKDGSSSVDVEHQAPRHPEVPFCKEKATYGEPTDTHFKQCLEMDIQGHGDDGRLEIFNGDDGRLEISSMNNTPAKVHADPEMPEKEKTGGFSGEPKRVRKLWDTTGLKRETVNLLKYGTSSMGVEHEAPRLAGPFFKESTTYQETNNSHFKQRQGMESSLEGHDENTRFDISFMNNTPTMVQPDPELSGSFLEDSISRGWHGRENHSVASAEETPLVGESKQSNNREEIMCNSAMGPFLCEKPNIHNIDQIKETQVKISDTKESVESHETCEKEKFFDSVYEANIQNESERQNEGTSRTLIHEENKSFRIAENADAHEDFQEGDVYQDPGSPEKIANINEDEEGNVHNVSVGHGKMMEANPIIGCSLDKDPYPLKEPQGSLGSRDLENRTGIAEDIVSEGYKEAKESMLESAEVTLVEEVLNHASKEVKNSTESRIHDSPEVYAEVNARSGRNGSTFHSVSEVIGDDGSDYAAKTNARSNTLQVSFSEACTHVQHLFQNAGYSAAEKADKRTPVKNLLEEDLRESDREILVENSTPVEEQKTVGKMEERDSEESISNEGLKDHQFSHLYSDTPKFVEDTASDIVRKSRGENLDVHRTNKRDHVKYTKGKVDEEEAHISLDEEKEEEWKIKKEKEDKERRSRELEEKERELERAKDRLAVQRATREAHGRAFAEARAKAERITLERIASARQRASAEARGKEEQASAEAAAEKAFREARLKAERSAVERATAEARERAIEKAKAAADAKDRMGRFRSSFKDSSKTINQNNIQETQFQKRYSNNQGRSMDSCNEVVKVESALRHKAESEREQRTTERAAKALAEKKMRDMLAQREQAERHRLAEFLDPEVKRWSSGKEGNLRALLSTLQYILGADSGWQSVPLSDLITAAGVKKAYRRATLCVHPDKLQQRGATIRQKYICEKVFDLLKDAWNKYSSE